ncbi:PadR family transcriptional regulator [Halolamina rubra]|uniref:PadR family transcriptional regulator n=1 Tax=Halolamina rubra TaxID=1380430 RepID=UPI0009E411C9|nr:PadR family transcriptional regulator [Halolamina rubra]
MSESDTRGNQRNPTDRGSSTESDTNRNAAPTGTHATDLTAFQRDILAILAEEARYGLAIKEALQEYMDEEVNHGRLYPNLDELVDDGLVEKSELDKRTNLYELTTDGAHVLRNHVQWLGRAFDGGDA